MLWGFFSEEGRTAAFGRVALGSPKSINNTTVDENHPTVFRDEPAPWDVGAVILMPPLSIAPFLTWCPKSLQSCTSHINQPAIKPQGLSLK